MIDYNTRSRDEYTSIDFAVFIVVFGLAITAIGILCLAFYYTINSIVG